jgi:hypothetical protein
MSLELLTMGGSAVAGIGLLVVTVKEWRDALLSFIK